MSEQKKQDPIYMMYCGRVTVGEIVTSPIMGEKIKTSGMLLEPYEAVLESEVGDGEKPYLQGVPEDTPGEEWMED